LLKNRDGTSFIISYTPVEYGKVKIGRLIIQTDEMYYSFVVRGTFPQYKPPNFTTSRLDNKLEASMLKKLGQTQQSNKNYVNENIAKTKKKNEDKKYKTFYG
jgi:hypothetical protein